MGDYLVVSVAHPGDRARSLADELLRLAGRHGYATQDLNETTWLATSGPNPAPTRQIGAWTMVGDVLNRNRPSLPTTAPADPLEFERKMFARFWGRFVGFRFGRGQRLEAVTRDPSGALDCIVWEQDELRIICNRATPWLLDRLSPPWRINLNRLREALHDPLAGSGTLLIDGPVAVPPGAMQELPLTRSPEVLWAPSDIACKSLDSQVSADEAKDRLRAAVDEAVAGFATLPGPIAAEVSGGLDSSLVAASLTHFARTPVSVWLNAYGDTPEADERVEARRVGDALGFTPRFVPHASADLNLDDLVQAADFRPNPALLDTAHDKRWAQVLSEAGVTALLTGKGGDSIFVQAPSTDVFIDLWQARGWKALRCPDMAELATSNEISLWTMLAAARRSRPGRSGPLTWRHPMLVPLGHEPAPHPWLEDCDDFGPAKIFQIVGVADSVSHNHPTALSAVIDVRNPLGALPVVEACLAFPTWRLALGGRDRGLARAAFRDRLPDEVLDRRSKGDMTKVYSRLIAENLDVLRPWLIHGRLADLGLIDPVAADTELTAETLMWRGQYAPLLAVIVFEAWVRKWEARLGPATAPLPATSPTSRESA